MPKLLSKKVEWSPDKVVKISTDGDEQRKVNCLTIKGIECLVISPLFDDVVVTGKYVITHTLSGRKIGFRSSDIGKLIETAKLFWKSLSQHSKGIWTNSTIQSEILEATTEKSVQILKNMKPDA